MIARRLFGALTLEALLLLLATVIFARAGTRTATAVLSVCLAVPLLNTCGIVAGYAVVRRFAASLYPSSRRARTRSWRCTIVEHFALFAAFVVIQPFERLWMGKEAVGALAPERTPVLLVHGYLCNRGVWWWLRRRLLAHRYTVATTNLEPPLANLDRLAEHLEKRIAALLRETGAPKIVLVTHSMGALVSLAYLRRFGAAKVQGLVTLAAPMHGTQIARLGLGANAREMRPDSAWLRHLNGQPLPPIPITSIWSRDDEIMLPSDTSRLAGTREIVLEGLGHMAMVFSPRVLQFLESELARGSSLETDLSRKI